MKIRSASVLCLLVLLALGASSLTAQEPARIVVEEGVLTLQPGERGQITASVFDADGNAVDAPIMYMARGARGRLDVNRTTGAVEAVYGGDYLVTLMVATDRNIRAEMTVSVPYPALDRVEILPGENGRFYVGTVMRHRATVYDAVDDARGDVELGWSTSDESVASVDRFGVLSAHAPGRVTLTAAAEEIAGEVVYDVVASPVTSISLSGSQEVGRTGDVIRFEAAPMAGNEASDVPVTYSVVPYADIEATADFAPAEIDQQGRFVGVPAGRVHGHGHRSRPLGQPDHPHRAAQRERDGGVHRPGRRARRAHLRPVGVGGRRWPRLRHHRHLGRLRRDLLVGRDRSGGSGHDRLAGGGRAHHQRREGLRGRPRLRDLARGRLEPAQRHRHRGLLGPAQRGSPLHLRRRADRRGPQRLSSTTTTCTR